MRSGGESMGIVRANMSSSARWWGVSEREDGDALLPGMAPLCLSRPHLPRELEQTFSAFLLAALRVLRPVGKYCVRNEDLCFSFFVLSLCFYDIFQVIECKSAFSFSIMGSYLKHVGVPPCMI